MDIEKHDRIRALQWRAGRLRILDQRALPARVRYLEAADAGEVADAIAAMVVRGAPAIGIAAAYGVALACHNGDDSEAAIRRLRTARPTAVNLGWALDRMQALLDGVTSGVGRARTALDGARAIHHEDIAANRRMGELGAALLAPGSGVLTHCNTGSLATGGFGTALGVIRSAHAAGRLGEVYADETRPWLQGARLTAWELMRDRIPCRLLPDGAASWLMAEGRVRWVIVGADRVAANGDVANKIGTLSLAVNARHHGVGFMVVAPVSTIDPSTASGADIPIETRADDEVLTVRGRRLAPPGSRAWNPVFDITPASLVDVLVTERGTIHRPDRSRIASHLREPPRDGPP